MSSGGSGGTQVDSATPAAEKGRPAGGTQDLSTSGSHIALSLSAIIAAVWAGLWGFDWAASHLDSGQLFVAILTGLVLGTGLTIYVTWSAFHAMKVFEAHRYRLALMGKSQGGSSEDLPTTEEILTDHKGTKPMRIVAPGSAPGRGKW
jgi:hypothetical protein